MRGRWPGTAATCCSRSDARLHAMTPGKAEEDDPVPIFGSWKGIYVAVIACELLCIALIALFSSWRY